MTRFSIKKALSVIVFILIAVVISYYLKTHWQEFHEIKIVSWWYFTGLFLSTIVSIWVTSLFFKKSVEPYSLKLTFKEYFGLTMITLMGNYLIPFSGLGVRAIYMKKVYKFSYHNFLTTIIANWITNFIIYSFGGIVALIIYYLRTHTINWILVTVFLSVMIISLITFIPIKIEKKSGKIFSKIIAPLLQWQEYFRHKDILQALFVITFWQFIFSALMFYFGYLAFGFKITFVESFLPTALSLYSSVIRLVPGSFGFYEFAVVYPSKVVGLSITQGIAVSAITRLATMFWTFALGIIFSYILLRKGKREI